MVTYWLSVERLPISIIGIGRAGVMCRNLDCRCFARIKPAVVISAGIIDQVFSHFQDRGMAGNRKAAAPGLPS